MLWPAFQSMLLIPTLLAISGPVDAVPWSWLAGWWTGALLVCGAFWRFGWRRSAARQLYLWGIVGVVSTVFLVAVFIADVIPIPPTDAWLIALFTTFGVGLSAGVTAIHIASQMGKEDRSR
jgi:hypothetical protein